MDQYSAMSEQPKLAERLLAHARMCREVADECGNKELAADFNRLALECIQALHWNVSRRPLCIRSSRTCGTMRASFYCEDPNVRFVPMADIERD